MDINSCLANLQRGDDETAQLEAIEKLFAYVGDRFVFNSLCAVALKTWSVRVRSRIITLMKPHAEKACRRFAQVAANPTSTREHRLALVNLSLLSCCSSEAHAEVSRGLNHPDFEIRKAAFMSTGLFDDPALLLEIERFMERNRFFLVRDGAKLTASKISEFVKSKKATKRDQKAPAVHWLGGRVKT